MRFAKQRCRERRAPPGGERLQGAPGVGMASEPSSSAGASAGFLPLQPRSERFWGAKEGARRAKGLEGDGLHPFSQKELIPWAGL